MSRSSAVISPTSHTSSTTSFPVSYTHLDVYKRQMYDKAISSYKNAPAGTREDIKKKYQNNKLNLQGSIQNAIAHNDVVYDLSLIPI